MAMPLIEIYESFSEGTSDGETWEVRSNGWYWRLVAANGRMVADGSEGYASKSNARRAAINVANLMETADIVYIQ
jgi:hypothetical protein